MIHVLESVKKPGDVESLLKALEGVSDIDCDFNGTNGLDYTDKIAIKNGFDSTQAYLLAQAKGKLLGGASQSDVAKKFYDAWMDDAGGFFAKSTWLMAEDGDGNITAISFAAEEFN